MVIHALFLDEVVAFVDLTHADICRLAQPKGPANAMKEGGMVFIREVMCRYCTTQSDVTGAVASSTPEESPDRSASC